MSFLDKVKSKLIEKLEEDKNKIKIRASKLTEEDATDRIKFITKRQEEINNSLLELKKDSKKNLKYLDNLEDLIYAIDEGLLQEGTKRKTTCEKVIKECTKVILKKSEERKNKNKILNEVAEKLDVEIEEYIVNSNDPRTLIPKKDVNEKLWNEISELDTQITSINNDINLLNKIIGFIKSKRSSILPAKFNFEDLEEIVENLKKENDSIKELEKEYITLEKEKKNLLEKDKYIKSGKEKLYEELANISSKIEKIEKAEELRGLGFRTKEEAKECLKIESKDYVIIPIPNYIRSKDEIFNKIINLKVETDEISVNRQYVSYTSTYGTVNSANSIQTEEMAILVPISEIDKENIIRITSDGMIQLKKFEIPENSVVIAKEGTINEITNSYNTIYYNKDNIKLKIEKLLGEDYDEKGTDYMYYEVFNNVTIKNDESLEKEREIVNSVLDENYYTYYDREVLVNGKRIYPRRLEQKDSTEKMNLDDFEIKELENLLELLNDKEANVDYIYQKMLQKYMDINKKSKAQYNEEENTHIKIKGKRCWINPILPDDDNTIIKRAIRKNEDKIYKMMKLASLCNKIAHFCDGKYESDYDSTYILRKKYFDAKLQLLNEILRSKDKTNISMGKVVDGRGVGIAMDIPGYSTIVLHVVETHSETEKLINDLPKYKYIDGKENLAIAELEGKDTYRTPVILMDGINKSLLEGLLDLKNENVRVKVVSELDSITLQKLLVRLGYTAKDFSTREGRDKVIKRICTDDELVKLIEEEDKREMER